MDDPKSAPAKEDVSAKGTDDDAGRMRWLDPSKVTLFRDGAGHVRATVAGERSLVRPALFRAFPITSPEAHVELREEGGDAVGMLKRLSDLDAGSRKLAKELLTERYLVPVIREIRSLRHQYGMWTWEVATDRGEREFAIKSPRDDIRELPGRRVRIADLHGNTYEIPDVSKLDAASRSRFAKIA